MAPKDGSGSNAILCRNCFGREVAWRKERNKELSRDAAFDLPAWDTLKIYGGDSVFVGWIPYEGPRIFETQAQARFHGCAIVEKHTRQEAEEILASSAAN